MSMVGSSLMSKSWRMCKHEFAIGQRWRLTSPQICRSSCSRRLVCRVWLKDQRHKFQHQVKSFYWRIRCAERVYVVVGIPRVRPQRRVGLYTSSSAQETVSVPQFTYKFGPFKLLLHNMSWEQSWWVCPLTCVVFGLIVGKVVHVFTPHAHHGR